MIFFVFTVFGSQINGTQLTSAVNYVNVVAGGEKVKRRRYLAALTAYALALNYEGQNNLVAQNSVERLIGNVIGKKKRL